MTIAATRTSEFNIDKIVLLGYRRAGLLNEHQSASETKKVAGRDELEVIVKHLQTLGLYARSVVYERITVTAGTNEYDLSETTLDVIGSAAWIEGTVSDPDKPDTEAVVSPIDRETRSNIASKAATGNPALYYVDRTSTRVRVWVWPTPSVNGFLRFQSHRLFADSSDGNATPDLERFWAEYLIWELAHHLAVANSMDMTRVVYLAGVAKEKLMECRAYANPRGNQRLMLDHPTAWSR